MNRSLINHILILPPLPTGFFQPHLHFSSIVLRLHRNLPPYVLCLEWNSIVIFDAVDSTGKEFNPQKMYSMSSSTLTFIKFNEQFEFCERWNLFIISSDFKVIIFVRFWRFNKSSTYFCSTLAYNLNGIYFINKILIDWSQKLHRTNPCNNNNNNNIHDKMRSYRSNIKNCAIQFNSSIAHNFPPTIMFSHIIIRIIRIIYIVINFWF